MKKNYRSYETKVKRGFFKDKPTRIYIYEVKAEEQHERMIKMKSIMHDFYFGHISPYERPPIQTREYRELSDKIESEEEYFINKMSKEDYERFENYKELQWQLNTLEDVYNFSHGFKLALFMKEIFSDEDGPVRCRD